ncbi:MAG: hypothetical protein Q9220_005781 [cf. Caloplaca sp. 1 TL-2023]
MTGKGSSSKSTAGPISSNRQIPSDLSCLVLIEPLRPNYKAQSRRQGTDGGNTFWAPPNKKNAYHRGDTNETKLFRWKGGGMVPIAYKASKKPPKSSIFGTTTIFTQYDDTTHFLAVLFDAELKDVVEDPGGWKVLSFDHIPLDQQRTYSSVDVFGDKKQLAAKGNEDWLPQLVPEIYKYDASQNPTRTTSAGLIGHLPILFALPAFSARPEMLTQVLTGHMSPNRWEKHNYDHGRIPERGMVVTVYCDPENKKGSTKDLLTLLQKGHFGPFYQA